MSGADKAKLSNIALDVEQIKAVSITYSELKALRDAGNLVPGRQYRITDYHCTTTQADTMSADHQFDIIVVADTNSVLNENARACLHEGDTYFANSNLEKWVLKYNIDNNANWGKKGGKTLNYTNDNLGNFTATVLNENDSTFAGYPIKCITNIEGLNVTLFVQNDNSDAEHYYIDLSEVGIGIVDENIFGELQFVSSSVDVPGSGVITYLKDEKENECFYDFKNILFKRWKITECEKSSSLVGFYSCKNIEEITVDEEDFVWCYTFNKWDADNDCYVEGDSSLLSMVFSNKLGYMSFNIVLFGNICYNNIFGNSCSENTFGNYCSSNTFGNVCLSNTFGNYCSSNTFGNDCSFNTFGNDCSFNTFGNYCGSNTFGNICYNNIFGNSCSENTFGNSCSSNTFGNVCLSNTFENYCYSNTFGNYCSSNTFGTSSSVKNYVKNITLENGVSNTYINCTATTSSISYFQNVHVNSGINGKTLTVETAGNNFLTTFGSSNDTKINV